MEYSLNVTFVKCVYSNTGNYINYKPDLFKNLSNFPMAHCGKADFQIKLSSPFRTMDLYTAVLETPATGRGGRAGALELLGLLLGTLPSAEANAEHELS